MKFSITSVAALMCCSTAAATVIPPRATRAVDPGTNLTAVTSPIRNDDQMHVYEFFATSLASNTSYVSFLIDPAHPSSQGANYSCADIRPSPSNRLAELSTPMACTPPPTNPDLPALSFTFAWSQDVATVGRELRIAFAAPALSNETTTTTPVTAMRVVPDWMLQWTKDPSTGVTIQLYSGPDDFAVNKDTKTTATTRRTVVSRRRTTWL